MGGLYTENSSDEFLKVYFRLNATKMEQQTLGRENLSGIQMSAPLNQKEGNLYESSRHSEPNMSSESCSNEKIYEESRKFIKDSQAVISKAEKNLIVSNSFILKL